MTTDKLTWDKYESIMPIKFSPFMDSPLVQQWVEEAREYCLMNKKQYNICKETWKLALVFHPFCEDPKRMEVIVKLNILLFVWDDHTECKWGDASQAVANVNKQWGQFKAIFDRLFGEDIPMIHWKPYIVLGYMVFEEIFKEISETGRKRIAKHLKMSADAYIQENKLLRVDGGLKFKSVEEMLQFKRGVQIAWITPMCFEYTDGISVSDEEWDDPHFQECIKLYYIVLDLSQDLGSFAKEIIQEDGNLSMINNVVALTAILDKCANEEAMSKVTQMYADYERKAKDTWTKYGQDGTFSANQKAMFEKIEYILGGHVWLVKTINRYTDLSIYDNV